MTTPDLPPRSLVPASAAPRPPAAADQSGWWSAWGWTVLATVVSLAPTFAFAFIGFFLVEPIAGATPSPTAGTIAWLLSALFLGGGFVAAPGPGRPRRVVAAVLVAAVWFSVGRWVLSTP